MKRRTKARIWTLQILYAHEITGNPIAEVSEMYFRERDVSKTKKAYTEILLECYESNRQEVDGLIEESVSNWRVDRLSVIDKNILRISICELLYMPDIPGKASINEAIELSRIFGGDDSPRFVNGVLDFVLRHPSRAK